MKTLIFILTILTFTFQNSFADIIKLKNGNSLEGKIISEANNEYKINIGKGTRVLILTVSQNDVEKIIRKSSTSNERILKEYNEKLARVDENDPESWYQFGLWCKKKKVLEPESYDAFEKALALNPAHSGALAEIPREEIQPAEKADGIEELLRRIKNGNPDSTQNELGGLKKELQKQKEAFEKLKTRHENFLNGDFEEYPEDANTATDDELFSQPYNSNDNDD